MAEVLFFVAGLGAIAGAIGVVALRNPFFSVLSLVFHLLSLAALFLLLRAEFVAAAQVIVYAGAVMVLYVFVVSYIGAEDQPLGIPGPGLRITGLVFGAALFVELCIATLGSGLKAIDGDGAPFDAAFGSPEQIGELLLTDFLLAFEVASFLLLVAAVGGVVLARRRRGLEGFPEVSGPRGLTAREVAQLPRTGTQLETGGSATGAGGGTPGGTPRPAGRSGW